MNLPTQLGPYRISRHLGEGGMGAVFEAVHDAIERRVAIKVLKAEFARNADVTARFFNEARAVNRIDHPSLVQISDFGQTAEGTTYIVMEFLKGETLAQRLERQRGRFALWETLEVTRQIAAALSAAHEKGIVHRDLKPENIMLVPDPVAPGGERAKLLDFGIAKLIESSKNELTASHVIMGTPSYMSPEQCRGAREVDGKTDVYSLGVILYRLLTGRLPFEASSSGELIGMHLFKQPKPLAFIAPQIPANLAHLVDRLIEKDKLRRPAMPEVATALARLAIENREDSPPTVSLQLSILSPAAATPAKEERSDQTLQIAAAAKSITAADRSAARRTKRTPARLVRALGVTSVTVGLMTVSALALRWLNEQPTSLSPPKIERANKTDPAPAQVKAQGAQGLPTTVNPLGTAAAILAEPSVEKASKPSEPMGPQLTPASLHLGGRKYPARLKHTAGGPTSPGLDERARLQMTKPPPEPRDRLHQGVRMVVLGLYAQALVFLDDALVIAEDPALAWRMIGVSACHTLRAALVNAAYLKTDVHGQEDIRLTCQKQGMSIASAANPATAPATAPPKLPAAFATPATENGKFLDTAMAAYSAGFYKQAFTLAQQARLSGSQPQLEVWRVIGLAACQLEDINAANLSVWRTHPDGQREMVDVCQKKQIIRGSEGRFYKSNAD